MNGGLSLGKWERASEVAGTAKVKVQGNASTGEGGDLDMQVREGPNCSGALGWSETAEDF